ncbi:MAG: DNA polymerase domain-containing protein [Lentisphaeria bacterium]
MKTESEMGALVPGNLPRLVAVESGPDGRAVLFTRGPDGAVRSSQAPCRPWLLVAGDELAAALPAAEVRPLTGGNPLDRLVLFPDATAYEAALKQLKTATGKTATAPEAPYRVFSDDIQQALTLLPARLFQDLRFDELRRLQFDLETNTAPGFDFSNPERAEDAILLIALRDSTGWEECLVNRAAGPGTEEEAMLRRFLALVRERDPDVLEGHNVFNFDLPYLEARCKRYRLKLALGRDGAPAARRASRFTAGERVTAFQRYDVYGRQVVDTLFLCQLYDVSHRDMDSHGLKAAARYFGVAAPDRTYVEPAEIPRLAREAPDTLRAYAMDDVRETDALSRVLLPSYFHQARLIPFSLQNICLRGTATRIDALLVAAYLNAGAGLPRPQAARNFRGGLTEACATGVFQNVWHADVASLYPSIMVSRGLAPASDTQGLFPRFLRDLRTFRLDAKRRGRQAAAAAEREHFEALQSSFKVLINSFYGYVGFAQGTFNDYDLAETVTAAGREILESMRRFLEGAGAKILEMDTDGVYFVPPPAESAPEGLLQRLQAVLPPGIEVELDSTYAAMFSYKSKNYALLDHQGRVGITGAALKSRGLEPFQRRYIRELVGLLLHNRPGEAAALYAKNVAAIQERRLPLADFAQREVLSIAPRQYAAKRDAGETNRSAAYELALASGRDYAAGDTVAFYIIGDKKNVTVHDHAKLLADAGTGQRDENTAYYLDKLAKLHAKFAEFLPAPSAAPRGWFDEE